MDREEADDFAHRVAVRIRTERMLAGITQEMLAKATGLSRPSIVHIEAGRQGARLQTVYLVARALKIQPRRLLP